MRSASVARQMGSIAHPTLPRRSTNRGTDARFSIGRMGNVAHAAPVLPEARDV